MRDFDLFKHAVWRDVGTITPYVHNAKKHPESQVAGLAGIIAETGWDQPIVVDQDGVIIKGHGRRLAALRLGLDKVPVVVRTDLTPAQVKAARIADNKWAESEWDLDALKIDLGELSATGFDMPLLGFDEKELATLISQEFGPGGEGGEGGGGEDLYTKKIKAPVYEPSMPAPPPVEDLVDTGKVNQLLSAIEKADCPPEVKHFLRVAASRHAVFNYELVAEYYSHAPKEVQELMEQSALVIIDFDKAIEGGFVRMSQEIAEAYLDGED